jgi:Uma2 family endonuclease
MPAEVIDMATVPQTSSAQAAQSSTGYRTRWTTEDLIYMPDNGTRYEIIDGELFMAKQPHWHHEQTSSLIARKLQDWAEESGLGQATTTPGIVLSGDDNVIPDVVWISDARLKALMDEAGHLTGVPELVVEVLSLGFENEQRDRKTKLKLYESRGALEYWIADWRLKQLDVYRRDNGQLKFVATLLAQDTLTSPNLPGFECLVEKLFPKIV